MNICLFYVYAGASAAYYNLAFWQIAPRTKCPELWAGMGRVLGTVTFCITTLIIDLIFFIILLLLFAAGGFLPFGVTTGEDGGK